MDHLTLSGFPGRPQAAVLAPEPTGGWVFYSEHPDQEHGFARARIEKWSQGGQDGYRLHLYAFHGGAQQCIYIAHGNELVGEYRQVPLSPYNLECGVDRLHVARYTGPLAAKVEGPRSGWTPRTPTDEIRKLIDEPPCPFPPGAHTWPNVRQAYLDELHDVLARIPEYDPEPFDPRPGIVLIGGGKYLASAYVTIRVLRHTGYLGPIHLWHLPGEITERHRRMLAHYDVHCVDAGEDAAGNESILHGPVRIMDGWPLKAYAALWGRFEKCLILDADSFPVKDPTEAVFGLLDRSPAVFWPDNSADDLKPQAWSAVGLPHRIEPAFESGQFVFDKRACWKALWLANWFNQHSDYWYHLPDPAANRGVHQKKLFYGDKDLFHAAFVLTNTPYAMPPQRPLWKGLAYQHFDFEGQVLFQHRCRDKFTLARNKRGLKHFVNTHQEADFNKFDPELQLERFCFEALIDLRDELEGVWRQPRMDAFYGQRLFGQTFRRTKIGVPDAGLDITLQPDGSVEGGDEADQTWERRGRRLILRGSGPPTAFDENDDASFTGFREGKPVLLLPYTPPDQPDPCRRRHKPTYEIFCAYHKNVYPSFYRHHMDRVMFAKVGDCKSDFIPWKAIGLKKFSTFRPLGRHYAEYELLFNLYWAWKAGEYQLPDYVGFVQYDMDLFVGDESLFDYIDSLDLHERLAVAFVGMHYDPNETRYWPIDNRTLPLDDVKLRTRDGEMRPWLHRALAEQGFASWITGQHTGKWSTNELVGLPFPMCTAFFAHKSVFLGLMQVLDYIRESGWPDEPEHSIENRDAGAIFERLTALHLATRTLDWRRFDLDHKFMTGSGKEER